MDNILNKTFDNLMLSSFNNRFLKQLTSMQLKTLKMSYMAGAKVTLSVLLKPNTTEEARIVIESLERELDNFLKEIYKDEK